VKAKSDALRDKGRKKAGKKETAGTAAARLPHAERRAQILATAAEFFAENGLTGQTRRLAEACGVSQRLLYRFFPTKEDLVSEVYRQEILGAFKAEWFVELQDRSRPAEERFTRFYMDYLETTLTRKWLRLFLYASLADASMAPDYIASIVTQLLEVLMREAAHERGVQLPEERAAIHEMAWTLHGAISHYAIRRHIYKASWQVPEERVVAMHVRMFLAGLAPMVEAYTGGPT
jgi:AcrR family transcriptional regulator